ALAAPASTLALDAVPTHVTLAVDSDLFAVDARRVREVIRRAEVQPVPAARGAVLGVLVLRGAILVVVSLRALLGLGSGSEKSFAAPDVIIVGGRDRAVAVAVTRVVGLANVNEKDIRP